MELDIPPEQIVALMLGVGVVIGLSFMAVFSFGCSYCDAVKYAQHIQEEHTHVD